MNKFVVEALIEAILLACSGCVVGVGLSDLAVTVATFASATMA